MNAASLPDPVPAPEVGVTDIIGIFKALSDPIRITLVELIGREDNGEACFEALAHQFEMPPSSLSHHLKVLVQAGVLNRERRGTFSWLDQAAELLRPGGLIRLTGPAHSHSPESC